MKMVFIKLSPFIFIHDKVIYLSTSLYTTISPCPTSKSLTTQNSSALADQGKIMACIGDLATWVHETT